MQSRSVAEPFIQRFDYDISTIRQLLPILVAIAKKFAVHRVLAKPRLKLDSIPWGGEQVAATALEVPQRLGQKWILLALPVGEEFNGETHQLGRNPQDERKPHIVHICLIRSVPLPLFAPVEPSGSTHFEPASLPRQHLLLRGWRLGEA